MYHTFLWLYENAIKFKSGQLGMGTHYNPKWSQLRFLYAFFVPCTSFESEKPRRPWNIVTHTFRSWNVDDSSNPVINILLHPSTSISTLFKWGLNQYSFGVPIWYETFRVMQREIIRFFLRSNDRSKNLKQLYLSVESLPRNIICLMF